MLNVVIHAADVQDCDGARLVLDRRTRRLFPFIERIFADAGYQGPALAAAVAKTGTWILNRMVSGSRPPKPPEPLKPIVWTVDMLKRDRGPWPTRRRL